MSAAVHSLPLQQRPPSLEEALTFERTVEASVEPRFIDANGHMNVAWYVHLSDQATWRFFATLGIDESYRARTRAGMFAVEQHLRYLGELLEGDPLEIRSRLLQVRNKALVIQHVMIDPTRARLAASTEIVGVHTHLDERRALPFPPELAAALAARISPG